MRVHVKGLIGFSVVWLINGIIWWYFRSYVNFMFAVIMLLAAFASVLALWHYRKRLSASFEFSKNYIEKNNHLSFRVGILSEGASPPFEGKLQYSIENVFTGTKETYEKLLSVPLKKGAWVEYDISLNCSGMLEGKIEQFMIYDFLHIVEFYSQNKHNDQAVSYPRHCQKDYEQLWDLVEDFPKEEENKNLGNDYTLDCEVREYVEGDSLKNIHWKLTAKKDKLMIRERLSTGRHQMNVILQLRTDIEENDALMDSLRWLLEQLLLKEYPVRFFWWNSTEKRMKSDYIAESGKIEQVIYEILSMNAAHMQQDVIRQFELENKGATYIVVKAGEKKGAYIC